jgi:hypothetical protein
MKNPSIPMKGLVTSLCALLVSFAALTVRAQTATITEPPHDAFYSKGHEAPAQLAILAASITISDTLTLTVNVAGPLSALPDVHGSAGAFFWNFPLNTDNSTDPPGLPLPPRQTASADFEAYAICDGTSFNGVFVDRRPALTGGSALRYSIPVSVSGSRITLTVPVALTAQMQAAVVLPGATWNCDTGWSNTVLLGIGTNGVHIADAIGRQPWPQ